MLLHKDLVLYSHRKTTLSLKKSRALTQAEQRYSQIEKELLAQVFGLEHNHQYVYGRRVILYTDDKPLVFISSKPLASEYKDA